MTYWTLERKKAVSRIMFKCQIFGMKVFIRIVPVCLKETARKMFKTLKFTIFPEIFIYLKKLYRLLQIVRLLYF